MKKYKLIKEYPGSPKLGQVIHCSRFTHNGFNTYYCIDYPEFWEEVVEKDYEILFFSDKKDSKLLLHVCKIGNKKQQEFSIKNCINNGYWNIHSVKRLSDGEVFTIWDKCKDINTNCITTVSEITLKDTTCFINGVNINYLEKVKQPLFTTEDGVDIYPGDKISTVRLDTMEFYTIDGVAGNDTTPAEGFKYFSTREKAEEYILMNKPCLSINDVLNMYAFDIDIRLSILNTKENLKELVKERL